MKKVLAVMVAIGLTLMTWAASGLFIAGFVSLERLAVSVRASDEFAVTPDRVTIEGLDRLDREEVLLLAGLDRPLSWFDVDERRIELFIRSNGWIKECAVRAVFPDAVRIVVEEYAPALVLNKRETKGERGEGLYSIWFADREGTVFKKAFPREGQPDLPLLFVENETDRQYERAVIRQAIAISDEWRRHGDLCLLRSIGYDLQDGFSLECEFARHRVTRIMLGAAADDDILRRRGDIFRGAVERLRKKRLFAGEFLFDRRRGGDALVAGQVVHYRD